MARARNIKPGFFKNEDLAECSAWARLCFAGLWTLADREGRMEDRPKRIKGELFAFDSIEVEPLLFELERFGFILRYEVEGRGFLQIIHFLKHQNPHHKEPPSSIPSPQSPGFYSHVTDTKPEASTLCNDIETLGKTETRPGLLVDESSKHGGKTVLNPESGFLNPESTPKGVQGVKPPRPPAFEIPDWMPAEPWEEFVTMRRAKGKRAPFTIAAAKGIVAEVGKLAEQGHDPGAVLRQSVMNGWSGVFPIKAGSGPSDHPQETFV